MSIFRGLVKSVVGGIQTLGDAAGDVYQIENWAAWFEGREANEDIVNPAFWISFSISAVTTIPNTITMLYYWARSGHHHTSHIKTIERDIESPEAAFDTNDLHSKSHHGHHHGEITCDHHEALIPASSQSEDEHHHEGQCHKYGEPIAIGVPFGLSNYATYN